MLARKSVYFILPLIALTMMACGTISLGFNTVRGSGNVVSEERSVSGFEKVHLSGSGDLHVEQGNEEGLTIEAEDNLMQYINSEVRGDTLEIGFKTGTSVWPTRDIVYHLKVKNLTDISVSGSGNIYMDPFEASTLNLSISGSGNVNLNNLAADALKISLSGSGNFDISGKSTSADLNLSGSGKYRAGELETDSTSISIGGSGEATVWANTSLDIHISGSGNISYYGQPKISQSISGSGSINSLGQK